MNKTKMEEIMLDMSDDAAAADTLSTLANSPVISDMTSSVDYHDIIFVSDDVYNRPFSNDRYCKVCGKRESDNVKFLPTRKYICQKCASKESDFCRVKNVLIRTFKKLNIDRNTAIKILMEERELIYKDLPNRKEKIIIK